jgi:hypothetical protein
MTVDRLRQTGAQRDPGLPAATIAESPGHGSERISNQPANVIQPKSPATTKWPDEYRPDVSPHACPSTTCELRPGF